MPLLLVIVHIVVCIALIMIVLLQTGKGADMGAAFGGGSSQTLFGSTGASTFLSKATTGVAVVFMITCMSLAYLSTNRTSSSIVSDGAPVEGKTVETDVKEMPAETTTGEQPAETTTGDQPAATTGDQPAATTSGEQSVGTTTTGEQPVQTDEDAPK